jgi:hypothetical protein
VSKFGAEAIWYGPFDAGTIASRLFGYGAHTAFMTRLGVGSFRSAKDRVHAQRIKD